MISWLFEKRELKKGEFFLAGGLVCKRAGFIEKGLVRYYISDDGKEKTYDFGQEYNFVCNMRFIPQAVNRSYCKSLYLQVLYRLHFLYHLILKEVPDSVYIKNSFNGSLLFPTGSKYEYSNFGYFIIADIIRIVSHLSFPDYMKKVCF